MLEKIALHVIFIYLSNWNIYKILNRSFGSTQIFFLLVFNVNINSVILFYLQVDLRHLSQKGNNNNVRLGMDLQEYYISTEWDVMSVPAIRNEKYYPCCEEPYIDITFTVGLRRKSLFYTVNVILPCVGISFLSVLVFYLPSDSGEKVTEIVNIQLRIKIII